MIARGFVEAGLRQLLQRGFRIAAKPHTRKLIVAYAARQPTDECPAAVQIDRPDDSFKAARQDGSTLPTAGRFFPLTEEEQGRKVEAFREFRQGSSADEARTAKTQFALWGPWQEGDQGLADTAIPHRIAQELKLLVATSQVRKRAVH